MRLIGYSEGLNDEVSEKDEGDEEQELECESKSKALIWWYQS